MEPGHKPGLGLLAAMSRPRGGEDAPSAPMTEDDAVVPGGAGDVPEGNVVAAADLREAMRTGSDADFARAMMRFIRVARMSLGDDDED